MLVVAPCASPFTSSGIAGSAASGSRVEKRRCATTLPPASCTATYAMSPPLAIPPTIRSICASLVVAPLLPEVVRGDRDRGQRDQAHGQQVELGEKPRAGRRQVERRDRVRRE